MPCPAGKKLPGAPATPRVGDAATPRVGESATPRAADNYAPPIFSAAPDDDEDDCAPRPPPNAREQTNQATVATPRYDDGGGYGGVLAPPDDDVPAPAPAATVPAPAPAAANNGTHQATTISTLETVATIPENEAYVQPAPNLEDVELEKNRIQALITSFKEKSLKGTKCTLITESKRTPSRYHLDDNFETVSVISTDDACCMAQCRVASIEDIFCVVDDGKNNFPPDIVRNVRQPQELNLLIMVVFRGSHNRLLRFCMLLESDQGRIEFMDLMRILSTPGNGQAPPDDDNKISSSSTLPGQAAATHPNAGVSFFLRSVGVQGGRGALGPIVSRAIRTARNVALGNLTQADIVPYLAAFGYNASDHMNWKVAPCVQQRPRLGIRVTQHIEVAGHTWYMVESSLQMEGAQRVPRLDWQTPRRLCNIRSNMYDKVKAALGHAYDKSFSNTPFASRGGVPGTTKRLDAWFNSLSECLHSGAATPTIVAQVLWFLETPNPDICPVNDLPLNPNQTRR